MIFWRSRFSRLTRPIDSVSLFRVSINISLPYYLVFFTRCSFSITVPYPRARSVDFKNEPETESKRPRFDDALLISSSRSLRKSLRPATPLGIARAQLPFNLNLTNHVLFPQTTTKAPVASSFSPLLFETKEKINGSSRRRERVVDRNTFRERNAPVGTSATFSICARGQSSERSLALGTDLFLVETRPPVRRSRFCRFRRKYPESRSHRALEQSPDKNAIS